MTDNIEVVNQNQVSPEFEQEIEKTKDEKEFGPAGANPLGLKRQCTFSTHEKKIIKTAIQVVKDQGLSYTDRDFFLRLSPFNYYLGFMNVCTTVFFLGHWPELYWIYQLIKCTFYLGVSWRLKLKSKDVFFHMEFCWVSCHMQMLWLFLCLLAVLGVDSLKTATGNQTLFLIFWALSTGIFGISAVVFDNALVLHDSDYLASCFIHLSPNLASWSMRWHKKEFDETWPGTFGIVTEENNVTFAQMVVPALIFYLAWWIPYTIWSLTHGKTIGRPQHEQETLFGWMSESMAGVAKVLGYDKANPQALGPRFKFCLIHLVCSTIAILISYPLFLNKIAHTIYVFLICNVCAWNGAKKYFKMMTTYYFKAIEKKLEIKLDDHKNEHHKAEDQTSQIIEEEK